MTIVDQSAETADAFFAVVNSDTAADRLAARRPPAAPLPGVTPLTAQIREVFASA